jgi:glycosyltransferase involved in cell wall biosynthesis
MTQPRVTFLILAYNHVRFVRQAVQSALAQDYGNLEIVISDDCSTDGTYEAIRAITDGYDGPHRLLVRRTAQNLKTAHLNDVLDLLSGEICVFANSDDVFYPNRVSRVVEEFRRHRTSVVSSAAEILDADGVVTGVHREADTDCSLTRFLQRGRVATCFGAGLAWHREVFDEFGPFPHGPRNIDIVIPFRGALLRGNAYIRDPLLQWRHHGANMTLSIIRDERPEERLVIDERLYSNLTANCFAMLDDVKALMQRNRDSVNLDSVRQALFTRIVRTAEVWSRKRSELAFAGHGLF